MTLPSLPTQGAVDWYAWAQAIHAAVAAGFDPEAIRDTIAAALVQGSGISITTDDTANTITIGSTASTSVYNVKSFGALGDGTTDDTAAINAATNAARMASSRRGGTVFFPAGRYLVSSPINLYTAVSLVGEGWSLDTANYNVSAIIASGGFSGTAIIKLNPDGATVSDPTTRPDRSWHWGRIEKMVIKGNGITGPHGIDPGWNGEASSIENVSLYQCNAGIYLNDTQASAAFYAVSAFNCATAVFCDAISGLVRIYGLSGDDNTNIIKITGGLQGSGVYVYGMKAESYVAGKGDPLIDINGYDGGVFALYGGNAQTDAARTNVIRVQQGAATNRPRYIVEGVDASIYTNLVNDVWAGEVVKVSEDGKRVASVTGNSPVRLVGQANFFNGGAQAKAAGYVSTAGASAYTFALADMFRATVMYDNASAGTFTIPPNASVPFPVGAELHVTQFGVGTLTVAAGAGVTIPAGSKTTPGQGRSLIARQIQANVWAVLS